MATYSLDNFASRDERYILIYDSAGLLRHSINPLETDFFYRNNNCICDIHGFNIDKHILLDFVSVSDAVSAMQILIDMKSLFTYDVDWSNIKNTPTLLDGYGITNVYTKTEIDNLITGTTITGTTEWVNVVNTPTILNGYGIVDVYTTAETYTRIEIEDLISGFTGDIDWSHVTNTPTSLTGYGITERYYTAEETENLISGLTFTGGTDWEFIIGKPNTLEGYGILNSYNRTNIDLLLEERSITSHTHSFSTISSKPNTIFEYGIIDSYTKTEVDALLTGFTVGLTATTTTTTPITSMITCGYISAGNVVPAGLTLQQFVETLLLSVINPTYTEPIYSLSFSQASGQEIGKTVSGNLTFNFNRGSINGLKINGAWNPSAFQNYRAGAAINYTINDVHLGTTNYITTAITLTASRTFSGIVTYLIGSQPLNSNSVNYGTSLAAGTNTQSTTITAIYPWFWGKVTGGSKPDKNQILISGGTKVVSNSNSTIQVNFNSTSNDWIWFAIPSTSTSKFVWYINSLNYGSIGGISNLFDTEAVVSINSLSSYWNGVNYKIYVSNYKSEIIATMELRNS